MADINYQEVAVWATGRSTGQSATCIARHLMGLDASGDYPRDGGDFGRCEALFDAVPSLRERLPNMASLNKYWNALTPRWDEIKSARDTRAKIREIIASIEKSDPNHIDLGNGVSMRVGRTV